MLKTVYAFDFDGTITDIPGEISEVYSCGAQHRDLPPDQVYTNIKTVFERYLPIQVTESLKTFFNVISSDPDALVTIHTRNYRNVVMACLHHHIGISDLDVQRSCFRESNTTKQKSLKALSDDPLIGKIYFFEDTLSYVLAASTLPKVKTVYCQKGEFCLGKLLGKSPVTDLKTLETFLATYAVTI